MTAYYDLKAHNARYADELKLAAARVIDSGWYILGRECEQFEQSYAGYIGTRHCTGCGNGLDALTLIYRAYIELGRMKPGDEVIVPANTFIASLLAITENGLTPVLVEPDADTLLIDADRLESAITTRTRSIMIVHLYGRNAYTEKVGRICREHSLMLVEDNAQAQGCVCNGRRTGSLGNAAGHSFYPGKNLGALGDAGAVTTDDDELHEAVRTLRNYGSDRKYSFRLKGRNSRLDEMQAALLGVRLRHLDEDNAIRQHQARLYYDNIECGKNGVRLPKRMPEGENVFHIFPILCDRRDELQAWLSQNGIETMIHYPVPPHRQECYREELGSLSLPVTEMIHREELSLPLNPTLTDSEILRIADSVNRFELWKRKI